MADEMVLETQQWLNKTYGSVDGFGTITEDGITGWGTIYGLIKGLQHELGITGLVDNFGPTTQTDFDKIASSINAKYSNHNIIYIIQGGFWCKGINPGAFNGVYSATLESAISTMKSEAGLSDTSATLNSQFMVALLNMSAFTLVSDGVEAVRTMQQWLNNLYSTYLGILPCDGVYQRDTNTALIFALQVAAGLSTSVANGNFGSQTETAVKQLNVSTTSNSSANLVKVIQYGLYLNGFGEGAASGTFSSTDASNVKSFRAFMEYPNESSEVADYTVIKGLVTSNGDTDRTATVLDCATQITGSSTASAIYDAGYRVVGRYLTGTVGTGSDEKDKNLTATEVSALTGAGLRIFPIYEDGGYEADYFSASQGTSDAGTAASAARKLGFPSSTVIYFAVDVDLIETQIDDAISYIKAVKAALSSRGYKTGIYGTRNVCLNAADNGISDFFVADMSYGWSGNLGFRMPTGWNFDQFAGTTVAGVEVDKVGYSGSDKGASDFKPGAVSSADGLKDLLGSGYTLEKTVTIVDASYFKLTMTPTVKYGDGGNGTVLSISDGKVNSADLNSWLSDMGITNDTAVNLILSSLDGLKITSSIKDGNLTVTASVSGDSYSVSYTFSTNETDSGVLEETVSLEFTATVTLPDFPDLSSSLQTVINNGIEIASTVSIVPALVTTFKNGVSEGEITDSEIATFVAEILIFLSSVLIA